MAIGGIGRRAWADLGGPPAALELVDEPTPPLSLPARLDVDGLLADAVALATLAIQRVAARGDGVGQERVRVNGDRVTTASQSDRHLMIDGERPPAWSPWSGFWRAGDGWVRTHGNYPHHARRLAAVLALPEEAPKPQVSEAIAGWDAEELETAAAEAGAIVGAVRRAEQWADHPQGIAVAGSPLVGVAHDSEGSPQAWRPAGVRPLDGVRVLDLTRVIAGPVGTRDLAFAGADVLRVDSPRLPELSWQHVDTGAGKRSTLLDLARATDRRTFEELLATADIVVTGYRPGALDSFGLSAESLVERRPGLVVGTVSAWGWSGPWGSKRGFDSIVQAVTGIAMVESPDGSSPGALPAQALDHSAGHLLAASVTHCLRRQRESGGSWRVEISLARIAHELLGAPGRPGEEQTLSQPTLQRGTTSAGDIVTTAPPLTYAGAPEAYPSLATAWGSDPPRWR